METQSQNSLANSAFPSHGGWRQSFLSAMGGCLRVTLAILVVVAAALLYIDINRESFYVFDPDVLHKVARETALMNLTIHEKVSRITHELHKIYPDHIDTHEEWIFNVAGGAMGQMTLLHCSITEYLIIFGTAIGTEGFSGIHPSDDYFTIIQGEQHSYYAGELEARIFKPGDLNLMPRGRSTGYRMPVPTYALEYARGNIPLMLPFGFADAFTSTMDFISLFDTVYHYVRIIAGQFMIGKI